MQWHILIWFYHCFCFCFCFFFFFKFDFISNDTYENSVEQLMKCDRNKIFREISLDNISTHALKWTCCCWKCKFCRAIIWPKPLTIDVTEYFMWICVSVHKFNVHFKWRKMYWSLELNENLGRRLVWNETIYSSVLIVCLKCVSE